MPIGIKTRNFSLNRNKLEGTATANTPGWMPGFEKKFEGTGIRTTSKKYQENYDKIDWSKK